MKTILFPTDFSKRANRALKETVNLAEKLSAKVIIYHVYHRPATEKISSGHSDRLLENLERNIDMNFRGLLSETPGLTDLDYEFRKELGILADCIVDTSEKDAINLVCMATKGAKTFGELWGTKTADIVKKLNVPVLVIPDNTRLDTIEKVGLICDYSEETNYHTLDFLLEIVEELKIETDVITLNRDEKTMTAQEKAYRELVRKKLENVPATFHFSFSDDVHQGVIAYCQTHEIGLIAILPKKYNFIVQLFRESLTKQMTFRSSIPLLVLK
ncbi:MAG: universal stress protein [Bacteroidota bacterium]